MATSRCACAFSKGLFFIPGSLNRSGRPHNLPLRSVGSRSSFQPSLLTPELHRILGSRTVTALSASAAPAFNSCSSVVDGPLRRRQASPIKPSLLGKLCVANFVTESSAVKPPEDPTVKESSEDARKKKDELQLKFTKYGLLSLVVVFSGFSGYLMAMWGAPPRDEEGNIIKDEYSDLPTWKAYLHRTWKEVIFYNKMLKEPSRQKLLPDPLTEPYYQPPYTLVIEMTGVLVHPDWTYKTGWRFKKRPGVDFFLQQAGPPLFEIVIYTSEQGFTAFPILESLDPNGYIMYKLFRDATRYENGHHIKDLSCLNRDLSRVIFVDWNEKSFQLQPENAFKLKKWTGNDDDTTLIDLAMFLRTIVANEVEDVRTVLRYYHEYDDPLAAFREKQRQLQEEQEKLRQRAEVAEKQQNLTGSWKTGLFGRKR